MTTKTNMTNKTSMTSRTSKTGACNAPSASARTIAGAITGAFLSAVLLVGCKKEAAPPGADAHGAAPTADPHAGHDHGAEHVDEVTLAPDAVDRYGIKVDEARLWVVRPTLSAAARVGFNKDAMAHIGSPLRGRIAEIVVRVGEVVHKGDVLAQVESPELGEAQAEFLQKRVVAQSAAPVAELAKSAFERGRALFDQSQGISLTEVQRRESEFKAAQAAQKAAEAAARGAELRLRLLGMSPETVEALASHGEIAPRLAITAPIDASVIEREITQGELVSPDREALMILADLTTLWVEADIPESRLEEIFPGAPAWITTRSAAEKRFEGSVAFISPRVDPATRTVVVRIEVPADSLSLRPGMFAIAEIATGDPDASKATATVAVPESAVQMVEGSPAVFVPVAKEANTFAKRSVKVGKVAGGLVPIESGLVEGEKFVASGTFILKADLGKSGASHDD